MYAALAVGLFALIGAGTWGAFSYDGWRTVAGFRASEGERVDFELRYRGFDAVLVESRAGALVRRAACESSVFDEQFYDPASAVRRQIASASECFRLATDMLLGFDQLRTNPALTLVGQVTVDGRSADVLKGESNAPWSELVLDHATGLPVSVTSFDDAVVEWHYSEMDVPSDGAAATSVPPSSPDEEYVDLSIAEVASALGVSSVPETLGGLRYETGFSYLGGRMTEPRTYAIWSDATGRQVQVIVSADPITNLEPVIERTPATISLTVSEGKSSLQIIATDDGLLREAVSRFRPVLLTHLP
jgi:hypothetical protein